LVAVALSGGFFQLDLLDLLAERNKAFLLLLHHGVEVFGVAIHLAEVQMPTEPVERCFRQQPEVCRQGRNVLRGAMTVDSLEPCGVYFGTTGGQIYGSADAGDKWKPIVRDLPAVLSVEAQTLP
jgi:hypothetical protein